MCQAAIVVVLPGGLDYLPGINVYHAAIVDNWLLGLVLRRSVCVCWPGILACQAAIVVGLPGRGSAYQGSVCVRPL